MRRRLFDGLDQGLGEELHLLEGLLPPTGAVSASSLIVCLQSALRHSGHMLSYAWLMGLTGAAWELRLLPEFAADASLAGHEQYLLETLHDFGYAARLLVAPDPSSAYATVKAEVMAQRPCLGLGWGSTPSEWSLLTGVQGQDVLGYAYGSVSSHPQRRTPDLRELLLLGSGCEPAPLKQMVLRAWDRAASRLEEAQAGYRAWAAKLAGSEPYGLQPGRLSRVLAEQTLVARIVDARDAGQEFLREAVTEFAEDVVEGLKQAADVLSRATDQLESLLVSPDVIRTGHLPDDLDWLVRRRETLEVIRETEHEALTVLQGALRLASYSAE